MTDPVLDRLLAAIVADPGDDGPRLAYADRLEETRADDARAEFIRCQCELWLIWPGDVLPDMRESLEPSLPQRHRWIDLRRRERELLNLSYSWVSPGVADVAQPRPYYRDSWAFRRGFVAEVSLPYEAWLLHGPALARAAPLTRVRLTDKQPYFTFTRLWGWSRLEEDRDAGAPAYLPPALYDLLPEPDDIAPPVGLWRTENRAEDALSSAALAWARAAVPEAAAP